jgi:hypothetical protein
MLPPST